LRNSHEFSFAGLFGEPFAEVIPRRERMRESTRDRKTITVDRIDGRREPNPHRRGQSRGTTG